jgi:ribonuclease P protein component
MAPRSPPARSSNAFGPERRIRRRADFVRVQSDGERASTRHFVLLVAANPDGEGRACPRIGIVATRKVGNSVERSRIKRLCRECFRTWPGFVPDGIDLVVIARAGAHELDLGRVRGEWEGARRALLERCRVAIAKSKREEEEKGHGTPRGVGGVRGARQTSGGREPKASSSGPVKGSARGTTETKSR